MPINDLLAAKLIDVLNKPLVFSSNASSSATSSPDPLPKTGPGIRRTRSN